MRLILTLWVLVLLTACRQTQATPTAAPGPTLPAPSSTSAPATAAADPTSTPYSTPTAAIPAAGNAFPDPRAYKWSPVAEGLDAPTDIQFPDDGSGRMFVLEQPGRIMLVANGQSTPFLDIQTKVGSGGPEQGLLGLALHPDFSHNPYFYVNYTDVNGDTVLARYQANGDSADPASEKVLLHIDQPFPNHNGGVLTFGPDGYLYAGLGDGGSAGDPFGNAQNKGVLLGKVLRVDVDHGDPYSVPKDNPFGNEIWEFGLRNPWRISFDRANGDLFIADVGQDTWEEVDYVAHGQGGLNFGWSYKEASHPFKGEPPATEQLIYPVAEYSHAGGRCSITGGYVYRGAMPEWQGIYFYADYCSGEIWGLRRSSDPADKTGWGSQVLFKTGESITTFGQDPAGELFYASRQGMVSKLGH